jgi:hypothetical protein
MGGLNLGPMQTLSNWLMVLILTGLSGVLDARGFVYASRSWPGGVLDWRWAGSAVLAFVGGLSCYVVAVRFLQGMGATSVAIQTGIWFVVTGLGVAAMDGSIAGWTRTQQAVALGVAVGLGWLTASTAGRN